MLLAQQQHQPVVDLVVIPAQECTGARVRLRVHSTASMHHSWLGRGRR
jgi:hypothetical protein